MWRLTIKCVQVNDDDSHAYRETDYDYNSKEELEKDLWRVLAIYRTPTWEINGVQFMDRKYRICEIK